MHISATLAVLGIVYWLGVPRGAQGCERIELRRPAQFITFERSGTGQPVYAGESAERVWLRLQNNTTCSIQIFGGRIRRLADGSVTMDPANGDETTVEYDIYDSQRSGQPRQWAGGDTHTLATIGPGFSVVFDVPTSHFKNGNGIAVPFAYSWEDGSIRRLDLRHHVYLRPDVLPPNLRGRLKRWRLRRADRVYGLPTVQRVGFDTSRSVKTWSPVVALVIAMNYS